MIADIIYKAVAKGEDLKLGVGKLIVLQKPGKPAEAGQKHSSYFNPTVAA